MIDMRSVSRTFGEKKAIDQLSFHVREGEIVGLLGLNGAGKSTVLKILGTLLRPSEGEASIHGFSVHTQAEDVRRHIGYLPDTPPVYDEMTVESYLSFAAQVRGLKGPDKTRAISDVMERTQLGEVRNQRISELSHGFRQRVNLSQALVHRPKVLILDEPINGLDPVQIVEMRDLIKSLAKQHTVILSSHILSEITRTCDRILVLDQGQLRAEGREDELRTQASDGFQIEIELKSQAARFAELLQRDPRFGIVQIVAENRLQIEAREDLRPEMARLLIQNGAELLSLRRREAELEALFMRLVSGGAQ